MTEYEAQDAEINNRHSLMEKAIGSDEFYESYRRYKEAVFWLNAHSTHSLNKEFKNPAEAFYYRFFDYFGELTGEYVTQLTPEVLAEILETDYEFKRYCLIQMADDEFVRKSCYNVKMPKYEIVEEALRLISKAA